MALPQASDVARAIGAKRHASGWIAKCPAHEDTRPSLTIRDGRNGLLLHCWAGCDFRDIARALESICGTDEPYTPSNKPAQPQRGSGGTLGAVQAALRIWEAAGPLCDVSQLYLERRGILSAPGVASLRSSHLQHPETKETTPAIIVPRHNSRRQVIGIQRIFLDDADATKYRDGQAKMSLGDGGVAMLSAPLDGVILLAEGPETALSAELLFHRPAWACCGGFPQRKTELPGVAKVLLILDNDASGNSAKKAAAFADANKEYEIRTWTPKKVKYDANDVWNEEMINRFARKHGNG